MVGRREQTHYVVRNATRMQRPTDPLDADPGNWRAFWAEAQPMCVFFAALLHDRFQRRQPEIARTVVEGTPAGIRRSLERLSRHGNL